MTKVQAFVYKIFGSLIVFSICEKVRLQQLRKAKYSILASISFFKNLFLQIRLYNHTYLYNTVNKSHNFLMSSFESGHIFQKNATFWKNSFHQVRGLLQRLPVKLNKFSNEISLISLHITKRLSFSCRNFVFSNLNEKPSFSLGKPWFFE